MEHALTECSDDIAAMKTMIKSLTANVANLENKDLESRSRRNNIRIAGVPERPDTCTTSAVAALLKEAFGLVREPLLDRSHQTLQPKPRVHPRVIMCRFHYHSDCVEILCCARELRQIKVRLGHAPTSWHRCCSIRSDSSSATPHHIQRCWEGLCHSGGSQHLCQNPDF